MSTNGLTVLENVRHQSAKGRTMPSTEPVLSKCPSHPTKRQFSDDADAVREARSRSVAAGMPIVAYRCDGCGMAHLCKKEHARAGSILKAPAAEIRALPPAAEIQLGNRAARLKAVAEYLADPDHKWPTGSEIAEVAGLSQTSRGPIQSIMNELGYESTRGKYSHWYRPEVGPNPFPGGLDTPRAKRELGKGVAARRAARAARTPRDSHTAPAGVTLAPVAPQGMVLDLTKLDAGITVAQLASVVGALGLTLDIQARPSS